MAGWGTSNSGSAGSSCPCWGSVSNASGLLVLHWARFREISRMETRQRFTASLWYMTWRVVGHFKQCFSHLKQSALAFVGICYMESEHRQGTRLLRPQHDARPVTQSRHCRSKHHGRCIHALASGSRNMQETLEHFFRQVFRRVEVVLDSLDSFGKSARKLLRHGGKWQAGFVQE